MFCRNVLDGIYYIFVAIAWWEPSNGFFNSEVYIWK